MCSEALCIAENIIHPRLPVVGIEAQSRWIADSRSRVDADDADTEPSLFGRQFDLARIDDQNDTEPSQCSVADVEARGSSVTESCSITDAPCTEPLPAIESTHTDESVELPAGDVVCSPIEETTVEVAETTAISNVESPSDVPYRAAAQELETSDSVLFVSAASSFAISANPLLASSRTVLKTSRENSVNEEFHDRLTAVPALASTISQCNRSDDVKDKLPECSESELSQQSLRKRKYSTTSSVNDGEDSESEAGEIEV